IQKRLLAYRCFNDPHTAQNISHLMFIILEEYGLTSKNFSISFDNSSANTCSIDELIKMCQPSIGGKFFHIRCTCHIFNLCVQDGLKSLELYIKPIRSAIHYLWTHPQVKKQWAKFCKLNGMRAKRFARDVPTRWNSTYKLLLSTFEYKDLLCRFFGQVVQSSNIYLYANQWNICTTICEQKKQIYPILSLMAKEIFVCPVSTVAVEQAFSMGGNTLDERRSTIRPENLEAQCLIND
ncbi:hypothetical protein F511_25933, partial [Dorcoceras hygrometricum]